MVTKNARVERSVSFGRIMLVLGGRRTRQTIHTRRRRLEADLLTRTEIEAVIAQCPIASWTGARNRTLIVVLWRTGLRISEVLALREQDVDLLEGRLVVQCGNGGRRRVVGLDRSTIDALGAWVKRRGEIAPPVAAPLFCDRGRNHVHVRSTIKLDVALSDASVVRLS